MSEATAVKTEQREPGNIEMGPIKPEASRDRRAWVDLIIQLKREIKINEKRYSKEKEFPYYRGYLDGQRKMIRSLEWSMSEEEWAG
jgi:hypothetical protein